MWSTCRVVNVPAFVSIIHYDQYTNHFFLCIYTAIMWHSCTDRLANKQWDRSIYLISGVMLSTFPQCPGPPTPATIDIRKLAFVAGWKGKHITAFTGLSGSSHLLSWVASIKSTISAITHGMPDLFRHDIANRGCREDNKESATCWVFPWPGYQTTSSTSMRNLIYQYI